MRAPLCSENTDLCPEDQGLIGSESESSCEIQAIEKSLEKNHSNKTAIFGVCLDNLMGTTPQVAPQIPFILTRLCRYIEEYGLHCKHLFLEADEKNLVESLKIEFIESGDAPLEAAGDVTAVARLLIVFFEELPEPLIPISAQPDFIEEMEKLSLNSVDCVSHIKRNVAKLPDSAYYVLKYLSRFLLRVFSHKEHNGMNSDNLGLIFGPVIFRLSSDNPLVLMSVKNIVNYFVQDYHAIFEEDTKLVPYEDEGNTKSGCVISDSKLRRQIPCPSSVMPVMSLLPLSVVIPSMDSNLQDDNTEAKGNVPVLLIEGRVDSLNSNGDKMNNCTKSALMKDNSGAFITRKRKERRLSGEDLQQRSSSEERPQPAALVSLGKIDLIRRCNSHEEMMEGLKANDVELVPLTKVMEKNITQNVDSYLSGSLELVVNGKNRSPHPPNAKRREVDSQVCKTELEFTSVPWKSSNLLRTSNKSSVSNDKSTVSEVKPMYVSKQNSIAEFEKQNTMDCDTSVSVEDTDGNCHKGSSDDEEFLDSQKARIPRSASCPVPKAEDDGSSESESSSLSLSWSMLFESEDSEPMRSEHRYSWPMAKDVQNDDALLSPSVQSLRQSSYCEAPLSPSAYRSYLSYRSTHLDPSVPPSPPVEQEDFAKNLVESNTVSDSIKQLTKKIHGIKRRIRKFDEKFEAEFGYKPSHAEKANNPDAKKLMNDLYKARKELKALKEESHLEHVSSATTWHPSRSSHILGDTTNHVTKDKSKQSIEDSLGMAMRNLADERKTANRPESVEAMTKQQIKDEKFAIQRALLQFESIHGKPDSKNERNTIRPLYDRYRNVKKLLVRTGSFPGALTKNKDICTELQPILEHEAMDFTSPQHQKGILEDSTKSDNSEVTSTVQSINNNLPIKDDYKSTSSSQFLALKYDNSNIHELPLSEMIFQLQQVKSEKRHLRKILREFETEFLRLNGRKVQKEDKAPVDTLYGEYKHVKARLKLLEALISKHDQHQLM